MIEETGDMHDVYCATVLVFCDRLRLDQTIEFTSDYELTVKQAYEHARGLCRQMFPTAGSIEVLTVVVHQRR